MVAPPFLGRPPGARGVDVEGWVSHAKSFASLLAAVSGFAYASGYLAIRARAHALGIDPALGLAEEAYVFAGFRFLVVTLLLGLLVSLALSPLVWALQASSPRLSPLVVRVGGGVALTAVGLFTVLAFGIVGRGGALLDPDLSSEMPSLLLAAVVGKSPGWRLVLATLPVLLFLATGYGWASRISEARTMVDYCLAGLLGMQLLLLPMFHGTFFADRNVRVLASIPENLGKLRGPVGIVDRSRSQYTLLARGADRGFRLISVDPGDVRNAEVSRIIPLGDFIEMSSRIYQGDRGVSPVDASMPEREGTDESRVSASGEDSKAALGRSFFGRLRDELLLVLDAMGSLGDDPAVSGQLWRAAVLDGKVERKRVGELDQLAYPVLEPSGAGYFVLRNGGLVRLNASGEQVEVLDERPRWRRLFGVAPDGTIFGATAQNGRLAPATRGVDGTVRVYDLDPSAPVFRDFQLMLGGARGYSNGDELSVDRSVRGGRGFDVFLERQQVTLNVSDCGDDTCGHAARSQDGSIVVFIREPR